MTWIGLADKNGCEFSPEGREATGGGSRLVHAGDDPYLSRGSLVIETDISQSRRPQTLLHYHRSDERPFHFSVQGIPGGGITLVLDQGGQVTHCTARYPELSRLERLRITFSWCSRARKGRMALERTDDHRASIVEFKDPAPLRLSDLQSLLEAGQDRYLSPEVEYLALSDEIEPVGPVPTLIPATPVATPRGYLAAGQLKRGDTVYTYDGSVVPVLHCLSRTVPARGDFAPVGLRAPYLGLQRDITVAPTQRFLLTGSEVEYLFGKQAVLVRACHLVHGRRSSETVFNGAYVTYVQVVLPRHEVLIAAGAAVESLNIGRLRRQPAELAASVLADLDRSQLPDHGGAGYSTLSAFDALVLAEHRAA